VNNAFGSLLAIFKRELANYFATPLALVFMVIFLVLTGVFTFYLGGFYEQGHAGLEAFFNYHPWLYLILVPAIAMRLWAEERKSGSIELIMSLPVPQWVWVVGKFSAAWVFAGINLLLTFPMWITVNYLGDPDNGVIVAGYFGSWLLAGGFLAISCCMSALSKSQVIAFVLSLIICFVFNMSGYPLVLDMFNGWAPLWLVDAIASISFLTHFESISKGVISLRDMFYFVSVIVFWLAANTILVDMNKAE
jgi:ABC-2 type transport system permease protein